MTTDVLGRRHRYVATLVAAAITQSAAGQSFTNVNDTRATYVLPESPAAVFSAHDIHQQPQVDTDKPIARPAHPPIHTIPPMPMPDPTFRGIYDEKGPEGLSVFDAETGQSFDLPPRPKSGLDTGLLSDGFNGLGGVAAGEELVGRNFGTMSIVGAATTFPRRGNVKLVMEFTDNTGTLQYFTCTGTMADAGVVLCAAHCIYAHDPNGINIFDFANQVWIYPGWDGNVAPTNAPPATDAIVENWGWARCTQYLYNTDFVNNENLDRDVAAMRVTSASRNVGMLTGWFGMSWGGSCGDIRDRTYHNYSYPAENCGGALHNGQDLYYWNGDFDGCPGNRLDLDTLSGCFGAVWGGMSGSGAYWVENDNRYVHAVCSTSNRVDDAEYCEIWEAFFGSIQDFEDTARGSTFDLEALMFRIDGSTTIQAGDQTPDATVQICNATNANPASGNYTVHVYLSGNNNISTGDTLLASYNYNTDFAALQNRTYNVPGVTIPINTAPGDYFIGVVIDDSEDTYSANNDTDTWDAQPVTITEGPPEQASGPSPTNFATDVDINANLDWAIADRTSLYNVYFGTDPTPDAGEYLGSSSLSARTLGPLDYDTTYYWRVDTERNGDVTTGPVWRFTTEGPPPSQAFLPRPNDNSINISIETDLNWANALNATSYNVYFGTDPTPDLGEFRGNVSASELNLPQLEYATDYYWRIDPVNDNGVTTGVVWEFKTIPPAACACEVNGVAPVDISDLLFYLSHWFAGRPAAEMTGDNPAIITIADLLEFLACWFETTGGIPCP